MLYVDFRWQVSFQPRDAHHDCLMCVKHARLCVLEHACSCSTRSLTATCSLIGPDVVSHTQHFHACALPSEEEEESRINCLLAYSRKSAQSRRVALTANCISMSWCDGESIVDIVSSLP
jgi:hypothetical protein